MRQGEVYWLRFGGSGSPKGKRPAAVVQADRFNRSAIHTTIVAAITSKLRLAEMPGNVRLRKGEANLPIASVVNVTQLRTADRGRLQECLGSLAALAWVKFLKGLRLSLDSMGVEMMCDDSAKRGSAVSCEPVNVWSDSAGLGVRFGA